MNAAALTGGARRAGSRRPPAPDAVHDDRRRQGRDQHAEHDHRVPQHRARQEPRARPCRTGRGGMNRRRGGRNGRRGGWRGRGGLPRGDRGGCGQRSRRVQGAVAGALRRAAGHPPFHGLHYRGGAEAGELGTDQRGDPGGERRGHIRGRQRAVLAAGRRHGETGAWRGQRYVRALVRERGELAGLRGGADREHAGISRRVVDPARARAVVPGGGDEHHIMRDGVGDRCALGRAAARGGGVAVGGEPQRARVKRQGDHLRAVVDRVPDAGGDRVREPAGERRVGIQRVVVFQRHGHGQDPGARHDAHAAAGAVRAVAVPGDQAGHRRAFEPPERPASDAARSGVVRAGAHCA